MLSSPQSPPPSNSLPSQTQQIEQAIQLVLESVNTLQSVSQPDITNIEKNIIERNCFNIKQTALQLYLKVRNHDQMPIKIISKIHPSIYQIQIDNKHYIMKQYDNLNDLNQELYYYEIFKTKENTDLVIQFADEYMDILRREQFYFEFLSPYHYTMERTDIFNKLLDIFNDITKNEDFSDCFEKNRALLKELKAELQSEANTEGLMNLINFRDYVSIINKILQARQQQKLYVLIIKQYQYDLKTFARNILKNAISLEDQSSLNSSSYSESSNSSISEEGSSTILPQIQEYKNEETIECIIDNLLYLLCRCHKFLQVCVRNNIIPLDIKCSNILVDEQREIAFSDMSYTHQTKNIFKIYTDGHYPTSIYNKEEYTEDDKEFYITFQFGILLCEFLFQCMGINLHRIKQISDSQYVGFLIETTERCFANVPHNKRALFQGIKDLIEKSLNGEYKVQNFIQHTDNLIVKFDLETYKCLDILN